MQFQSGSSSTLNTTSPLSLADVLSHVDQWSDLIADNETADQSINQEFANISSLLTKFDQNQNQGSATPTMARTVTQPAITVDTPLLNESSISLDQVQRTTAPQPYEYKAPADLQPATGVIKTTAAASGYEEPSLDTAFTPTQLQRTTDTATL